MNVSKQSVFALSLIIRIQSSKTQGMALNSSSCCCYVICKFPMFWKQPEFYVFYAQKNKYCFPFLQSFVCLNGNKTHSCSSKTALFPERKEHVVPSHTVCIVHVVKVNQADSERTLWPLSIDQFSDMPCGILFRKVWFTTVCCISLNSIFECLRKCVLVVF